MLVRSSSGGERSFAHADASAEPKAPSRCCDGDGLSDYHDFIGDVFAGSRWILAGQTLGHFPVDTRLGSSAGILCGHEAFARVGKKIQARVGTEHSR